MRNSFIRTGLAAGLGLAVLTACGGTGSAGGDEGKPEANGAVAMSFAGLDIQIWVDMLDMIEEQVESEGYELLSDDPQWNIQTQVSNWESWIMRDDLKAIMGAPVQTDAMHAVTQEASAAGVPVLGYSTEWEGVEASLLIDNYEDGYNLGKAAGEWIAEQHGDDEVSVFLYSNYDTDLGMDRSEGVKDGLTEAGANADFSESSAMSVSDSYDAAVNQLSADAETRVWLATGSDQMVGAYRALMENGVAPDDDSYLLGALDATNESLDIIEQDESIWRLGFILPAADLASKAAEMLVAAANGEPLGDEFVASVQVTAENADEFRLE